MKLGIIGLPGCGKTTIFNALTGSNAAVGDYSAPEREPNLAVVKVPDQRLEFLQWLHRPQKVTPATITYLDVAGLTGTADSSSPLSDGFLNTVRPVDALVHVLRAFPHPAFGPPDPRGDFHKVEAELILADLLVVERRLDRIAQARKRGKKEDPAEVALLEECRTLLNDGLPLRRRPELTRTPELRGYGFLSAKPQLLVLNRSEDEALGRGEELAAELELPVVEVAGKLEMELAQLDPEEAEEFQRELGIDSLARERVIQESFRLLGLVCFFTASDKELRAWTVPRGTPAIKAAGTVHSDMERGFIRAEVVSHADLEACGTYAAAQKKGLLRLEGKDYLVEDGDVITFRFNV